MGRPGNICLKTKSFKNFPSLTTTVKSSSFINHCGNSFSDFRDSVSICSKHTNYVLRFFVTAGEWAECLSVSAVGHRRPVVIVLCHGAPVGNCTNIDRACLILDHDCIVLEGSRLLKGEGVSQGDVIMAIAHAHDDSALYKSILRLDEITLKPCDKSGHRLRGDAAMKRFGLRACANVQTSAALPSGTGLTEFG